MDRTVIVSVLWIAWCGLHSLLLSRPVHRLAQVRLGHRFAFYRLFYIAVSILTLAPVVWVQLSLPQQKIIEMNVPLRIGQLALISYAVLMFYLGARAYDLRYFLGISQLRRYFSHSPLPEQSLSTSGILAHVRHPWYSGGIAFVWAVSPYTDVNLPVRIILTGYLILGTLHEEYRLRREFGEAYRQYSHRVPMLIPHFLPQPSE